MTKTLVRKSQGDDMAAPPHQDDGYHSLDQAHLKQYVLVGTGLASDFALHFQIILLSRWENESTVPTLSIPLFSSNYSRILMECTIELGVYEYSKELSPDLWVMEMGLS